MGAMIVKHKAKLSDEETVEQIRENPYLRLFVGFSDFQKEADWRERGAERGDGNKPNKGKMIVDAIVAEQAIKYPTDLNLLNKSRELLERMADELMDTGDTRLRPMETRITGREKIVFG